MIWDDETLPADIVWQVESDISVLNPVISEAGILSLEIADTSWTGIVTVKLIATDESGLSATAIFSLEIKEAVVTGVAGIYRGMEVYPNPVGDVLRLRLGTDVLQGGNLRLLDMVGRERIGEKVTGEYMELNVGHLESGMYILKIEDNAGKSGYVNKVLISNE